MCRTCFRYIKNPIVIFTFDSFQNWTEYNLFQAAETEALSEYFHYHFMTLVSIGNNTRQFGLTYRSQCYNVTHLSRQDLGVTDISEFSEYGANITALRLVNPEHGAVKNLTEEWKQLQFNIRGNRSPLRKGQPQIPV